MKRRARKLAVDAIGRVASLFYEVDRLGAPIPATGPVLVVANHPNSLLDPLVIFRTAGRPTAPMAKAPLFTQPILGTLLRMLGGLPVYRPQDDPALLDRNEATFSAAVAALQRGEAVQIYPEGRSHSEPGLAPLRTGAARIALRAEAESGWTLGLRIVPVGLTYTRKPFFRGRAAVAIGEPVGIRDLKDLHAADPAAAVRELTARISDRIAVLTVESAAAEDHELIETADRIYAREKRVAGWLERERLGARLPRMQEFARGLAWLRETDPARADRLERAVRRHSRRSSRIGTRESVVPPSFPTRDVLRYVARELPVLVLGLPVIAAALAVWWLPAAAPRVVVRVTRPVPESVATYKLAAAAIGALIAYAGWLEAVFVLAGAKPTLLAAAVLPLIGIVAVRWTGRFRRCLDDARVFLAMYRRPELRRRWAMERGSIATEFDDVRAIMPAAAARPAGNGPVAEQTPAPPASGS